MMKDYTDLLVFHFIFKYHFLLLSLFTYYLTLYLHLYIIHMSYLIIAFVYSHCILNSD